MGAEHPLPCYLLRPASVLQNCQTLVSSHPGWQLAGFRLQFAAQIDLEAWLTVSRISRSWERLLQLGKGDVQTTRTRSGKSIRSGQLRDAGGFPAYSTLPSHTHLLLRGTLMYSMYMCMYTYTVGITLCSEWCVLCAVAQFKPRRVPRYGKIYLVHNWEANRRLPLPSWWYSAPRVPLPCVIVGDHTRPPLVYWKRYNIHRVVSTLIPLPSHRLPQEPVRLVEGKTNHNGSREVKVALSSCKAKCCPTVALHHLVNLEK